MTPAIDCTPAASAIAQSSGGDGVVLPFSARKVSPRPGRRVSTSPVSFATSNTCSGRPRSMVKKLVMSTSALIGRRPIEVSRSCSHCGLGPLRRLRMVRPRIQGQASGQSICQRGPPSERRRDLGRLPRLQRADAGGGQVARDAADREAVAAVRRDADIDHRIVEPGPLRVGHADRRILGQIDDAGVVVAEAHLACGQQHAGTAHAADFADLQRDAGARDEAAGRRRTRPSCRCAHSARRRRRTTVPSPVSTVQTRSRSAFGCCTASTTWAMRNGASAAPRSSTPSSSSPIRVSVSVICGRACASVSRMRLAARRGELHRAHTPLVQHGRRERIEAVVAQPADVGFEERPQVGHAVLQHGDALDAHAPGEALPLARIDAAIGQHARMHHAAAQDLQPVAAAAEFAGAAVPADIHLHRGLGEREVAGAEAHRQVGDAEEGAQEVDQACPSGGPASGRGRASAPRTGGTSASASRRGRRGRCGR